MSTPVTSLLRSSLVATLVAALSVVACGGSYVSDAGGNDDDGNDSGGNSSGGVPGSGGLFGSGGFASSGGSPGMGATPGSGGECCTAAFLCDGDDSRIDVDDGCPVGAECYAKVVCCEIGYCMRAQAPCDALPVCEVDETEVSECPEGWSCTQRALCGTVITCRKEDTCDPQVQPNRNYVSSSESACQTIDYGCPEHTLAFADECGCGCEQPASCPRFLDCGLGGTPDPRCTSGECPYSPRGL